MFMLEGVNRSWQPLPRETHSSCMSVVWAGHKNYVFLTLDMCRPAGGHTYSILGPKAAKANWLPFPAPKVFSEIAATNFEEQRPNHHAADRAKRLTDAIAVLMRDISMDPVSCERRPAMEKKTGNLVTWLAALLSQLARTLWARMWHTMLQEGLGPIPPVPPHPPIHHY